MEAKKPVYIHQSFRDSDLMTKSTLNWQYDTVYKLMPNALQGENTALVFPSLQLSYAHRSGGILYTVTSPKGMLSVGIIERCDDKACFGETKLQKGDIVFFDDKKPNNLITSGTFVTSIIGIPKQYHRQLTRRLALESGKVIHDTHGELSAMMQETLSRFQQDPSLFDLPSTQVETEEKLIAKVEKLLEDQTPYFPKLTKGERIALQIRDRIYKRITKKVTITSLAEEFGVSEQTLQNAFKSLFGMTPNKFLRNLKLNHVRKVLISTSPEEETIIHVANRWGFTHMGHFSRYYTDLFGENPSVTLQRKSDTPST